MPRKYHHYDDELIEPEQAREMLFEFCAQEDGWISATGAIWVMIFVVVAGLAIDPSHAFQAKTRLAAATDAAALAAVVDLPDVDKARATAFEYLEKNMPSAIYGSIATSADFVFGTWDSETRTFHETTTNPSAVQVMARHSDTDGYRSAVPQLVLGVIGADDWRMSNASTAIKSPGGCKQWSLLGGLSDYLFYFDDAGYDANWQGATKGFAGDVAVNGILASERTSGGVPYSGTIYTNDEDIGAWQDIVDQNPETASSVFGEVDRINGLRTDLYNAFDYIDAMTATSGFENMSSKDLDGLNTLDGVGRTYVINITQDLSNNKPINITGDADDMFIVRWDSDPLVPGYQGQVKLSGGSGFNPLGGLKPTNFINVAGDINASGGGSTPSGLVDYVAQLPETVGGGGFFTGYWLTTGKPGSYESSSLSNGIFVGGWYTLAVKFSMTSGTSGAYVAPVKADAVMDCSETETVVGGILVD